MEKGRKGKLAPLDMIVTIEPWIAVFLLLIIYGSTKLCPVHTNTEGCMTNATELNTNTD